MTRPMAVRSLLAGVAVLVVTFGIACGPRVRSARRATDFDPALVRERDRRIAAFDSVVRIVNTDSAFKLWHAMLTAPEIRLAQLAMMCEYGRLGNLYGEAGSVALERMQDTLWTHANRRMVSDMSRRLQGESPKIGRDTCGERTGPAAPRWLRKWYVPALPELPPAPD